MKKRFIYVVCLCFYLLLTSCYGNSFQSIIVIKNNSQYSYEYVISCDEIYYKLGGYLPAESTHKTKVQSGHSYFVITYEVISLQLHSSKVVNAQSDKTYTITINN